jgi:predicted peroxiredoxin
VAICLFFGALDAWAQGRWDDLDPALPLTARRLEALDFPPLSTLLAPGREEGRIRLYACSASVRFLGLEPAVVQESVDAVLGWQSFARMVAEAQRAVAF